MKKTFTIITALVFVLTVSLLAVDSASDAYTQKYQHPVGNSVGLRALQDATPAIGVIAQPDASAITTNFIISRTYTGATNYITTNVVQNSVHIPLSWDSTLFPMYTTNGIPYGLLVMTNPPTRIIYDIQQTVSTTGVGVVSTIVTTTNATHTLPISNLWVNIDGSTNGWKLVQ